jgi:hypothetical protein
MWVFGYSRPLHIDCINKPRSETVWWIRGNATGCHGNSREAISFYGETRSQPDTGPATLYSSVYTVTHFDDYDPKGAVDESIQYRLCRHGK